MLKRFAEKLLGLERYYQAQILFRYRLDQLQKRDSLFIHTMGKVGSSTLAHLLRRVATERDWHLYWTHFLSEAGLDMVRQMQRQRFADLSNPPRHLALHFARGTVLAPRLPQGQRNGRPFKVITLVRDPVATNVSGFFQNFDLWPLKLQQQSREAPEKAVPALIDQFMTTYPHQVPSGWFDMEIRPLFGIDVYSQPFAHEKGYVRYRSETADLLLIQLEQLDQCGTEALADFLELENVTLERANVGEEKWYADTYQAFKTQLQLPESYFDEQYCSRFARHFYTPDQRAAFRKKWQTRHALLPNRR